MVSGATHDVTVVHVAGRNFAFETRRDAFAGEDCRKPTFENTAKWRRCELSAAEEGAVTNFMQHTGYTFGRLDFLRDENGLWFLELNSNGQYAWLDPDGREGVFQAVADEILAVHRRSS